MEKKDLNMKEADFLVNIHCSNQQSDGTEEQNTDIHLKTLREEHPAYHIEYQKNTERSVLARLLAYKDKLK